MRKLRSASNTIHFEELESRILLSAGAEIILINDAVSGPIPISTNDPSVILLSESQFSQSEAQKRNWTGHSSVTEHGREIVFVDANVENAQQIVEQFKQENSGKIVDFFLIDSEQDGILQVSETLSSYQALDAIHFITHGASGEIQLGESILNNESITQYADEIETWGQALSEDADFLFYGCDIASNEQGEFLISQLSDLTGADVAASINLTGTEENRADWILEYQEGDIQTLSVLTATTQQIVQGTLALAVADATVALDENSTNGTLVDTVAATGADLSFQNIVWIDQTQNRIVVANTSGTPTSYITGLNSPTGIAIDNLAGKVYWSNNLGAGLSEIKRADLDGNNIETIVGGLSTVDTLTIDRDNSKIYWTDSASNEIGRTDMAAGSSAEILFSGADLNVTTPQGIDFDNTTRTMYVFDSGAGEITTFDVDNLGAGVTSIVTGLGAVGDVTVDPGNKIYFTDGAIIQSYNLDGSLSAYSRVIANDGHLTVNPLAQTLHFSNDALGRIYKLNFSNNNLSTTTQAAVTSDEIEIGNPAAVVYSITAGNTNNAFSINSVTGAITVNDVNELDFETTTSYSLTVTAKQNASNTTGTITVNINNLPETPPTATVSTVTTTEDTSYIFTSADFNFSDVDGDSLASIKITSLETVGSLEFNGVAVTLNQVITVSQINSNLLVFIPVTNANSTSYDSFSFSVNDGGLDSISSYAMTIDVTAVNDAPDGSDNTVTVLEDTGYTFSVGDFGFSDTLDNDAFAGVKITTLPGLGSLTLNGVAVTSGDFINVTDITSDLFVFTPASNSNGVGYTSFTFQVQDDGGTTNGGVNLDAAANQLTIDVTSINDAPNGNDILITMSEDAVYTFSVVDFGYDDASDSDVFSSVRISTIPLAGSLTLNGVAINSGDVISVADITSNLLHFTPVADANGAAYTSFTFQVVDDGGSSNGGVNTDPTPNTITIDVVADTDAPTSANNTILISEDVAYTFSAVDFNFSDVDTGDSLVSVKIVTLVGGGSLELDGVAVNVNDVISIASINTGKLKYLPAINGNGENYDNFGFVVNDGVLDSTVYTMTFDVTPVNDAPTSNNNVVMMVEDTSYLFSVVDFNYSDVEGDSFSSIEINSLGSGGSLELNGVAVSPNDVITIADINSGNLIFTPAENENGVAYSGFGYSVNDGELNSLSYSMVIDVVSVNDAPTATDTIVNTDEGVSYIFLLSDFGFNDVDADPFSSLTIKTLGSIGTLELNNIQVSENDVIDVGDISAGNLKFVPAVISDGDNSGNFVFSVSDGTSESVGNYVLTIAINMNNINDGAQMDDSFSYPISDIFDSSDNNVDSTSNQAVNDTKNTALKENKNNSESSEDLDLSGSKLTEEKLILTDILALEINKESNVNLLSDSKYQAVMSAVDFVNSMSFDLYKSDTGGYNAYSTIEFANIALSKLVEFNNNFQSDTENIREILLSILNPSTQSFEAKLIEAIGPTGELKGFVISDSFNESLALLRMQLSDQVGDNPNHEILIGTVKSSSVVLAASLGTWVLRGSTILASVLSALPMWNSFDPLPILSDSDNVVKDNDDSNDEVDNLFNKSHEV